MSAVNMIYAAELICHFLPLYVAPGCHTTKGLTGENPRIVRPPLTRTFAFSQPLLITSGDHPEFRACLWMCVPVWKLSSGSYPWTESLQTSSSSCSGLWPAAWCPAPHRQTLGRGREPHQLLPRLWDKINKHNAFRRKINTNRCTS